MIAVYDSKMDFFPISGEDERMAEVAIPHEAFITFRVGLKSGLNF